MFELLKLLGILLFLYTVFAVYIGSVGTIMGSLAYKFDRREDPEMFWLVIIIYLICVYILLSMSPEDYQLP